jgi:hypothetical protein
MEHEKPRLPAGIAILMVVLLFGVCAIGGLVGVGIYGYRQVEQERRAAEMERYRALEARDEAQRAREEAREAAEKAGAAQGDSQTEQSTP